MSIHEILNKQSSLSGPPCKKKASCYLVWVCSKALGSLHEEWQKRIVSCNRFSKRKANIDIQPRQPLRFGVDISGARESKNFCVRGNLS